MSVGHILDPIGVALVSAAIAVATFLYATRAQKNTSAAEATRAKAREVTAGIEAEAEAFREAQADIVRLTARNEALQRQIDELHGAPADGGSAAPDHGP